MFLQRTLKSKVVVKGVGLHTGKKCSVVFSPAPVDTGIHIIKEIEGKEHFVKPEVSFVTATQMATTLSSSEFKVATVEHCLSAVAAFRIDNLFIKLEGGEIPIMDGSALEFAKAILEAGFIEQDSSRKYAYIENEVSVKIDDKWAKVEPYNGLRISCTIDFEHPIISKQNIDIDINEENFLKDIAPARTFGFLKDAEYLKNIGLALGGSLDNAIILDDNKMLNKQPLRFENEFVRHKVLDTLGDLSTFGQPVMGHFILYKSGHELMNKLVSEIKASPSSYTIKELASK